MEVVIKNVTGSEGNKWSLWELSRKGIVEGQIVNGVYHESNQSVTFTNGGDDCVAWIGKTCEVIR